MTSKKVCTTDSNAHGTVYCAPDDIDPACPVHGFPTITPRMKIYKTNADRSGWHVFKGDDYLGYYDFKMSAIVESDTLKGWRLAYIGGNGLGFIR